MISSRSLVPLLIYGDYSESYVEDVDDLTVVCENGQVQSISDQSSKGIGLRILQNGCSYFGYVDGFSLSDAENLMCDLSFQVRVRDKMSRSVHLDVSGTDKVEKKSLSLYQKINFLCSAMDYIKQLPEFQYIRNTKVVYNEKKKDILCVYRKKSAYIASGYREYREYVSIHVVIVGNKQGVTQVSTEVFSCLIEDVDFSFSICTQLVYSAFCRVIKKLDAVFAPVGEMQLILDAEAGGTMIHEAIGHSLEADAVQMGVSPAYVDKIGEKIASSQISVYDNPTVKGKRGSFRYDDEGIRSSNTMLIENGILKNYLYDRVSASKDRIASNGHGRRESYKYKPIPRMSNTYIASGSHNPDLIRSSVQKGLFVKRMGGGQVNPVTNDFVFEVEEGYLISDGQVSDMVKGASLMGNGPQILNLIDLVGNDLGWGVGTCGKDGQGVPVADAQPTMRISSILIGGQEV